MEYISLPLVQSFTYTRTIRAALVAFVFVAEEEDASAALSARR